MRLRAASIFVSVACAPVLAVFAACSPFDASDAGITPSLSDGGAGADGGAAADGATVERDASPPACARRTLLRPDFTRPVAELGASVTKDTNSAVDTEPGGATLRASGAFSEEMPEVSAFIEWELPAQSITTFELEYDLAAGYDGTSNLYGELGCRIDLRLDQSYGRATLIFQKDDAFIALGGRQVDEGGITDIALSSRPRIMVPPFAPGVRHVTMSVTPGTPSQATAAVDGLEVATALNTPAELVNVRLACGILFSNQTNSGFVSVSVTNLVFSACE